MSNAQTPTGNPGVVGLAGFGLTTMLLQFHNVGWCGVGPIVALAFVFGGLAQMIAGFQEFKCGNNFGYSAFVAYGSFWIALGIIFMFNYYNIYHSGTLRRGVVSCWLDTLHVHHVDSLHEDSWSNGDNIYAIAHRLYLAGPGSFRLSGNDQGRWL